MASEELLPEVLRPLAAEAAVAAVLLDFDGTLSEIAPTPEEARAVPGVGEVLESLAARVLTVAVVSGRRAEEVRALLQAPSVRVLGLYGLEDGTSATDGAGSSAFLSEVERIAREVPGSKVEPKGRHVAVHYRGAADPDAAERMLRPALRALAAEHDLEILPGKRVLELAPGGGPSKGDAVRGILSESGARWALYAGDDLADLTAFAALDATLGRQGVKVAVRSTDTPESVWKAADLAVNGPAELVSLLAALAG